MQEENEWKVFFDGHAPIYMTNSFTRNTLAEVDFLVKELKLTPEARVLDVGCGAGRHSVELAKRGYRVTGVDISTGMLTEAANAARRAGVEIELVQADASSYKPAHDFDAAVCLCEGAFGLLGTADDPIEHDLKILHNISATLKTGGRFILTALNGCRMIRKYSQEDVAAGRFDPLHMCENESIECDTSKGKKSVAVRERGHVPTELAFLFSSAGLAVEHIGEARPEIGEGGLSTWMKWS